MPTAPANGIEIYYETDGARSARPLLLLRGLGTQLIHWAPGFRRRLADAGHFLVVFDSRDAGLSSHLADAPVAMMSASQVYTPESPVRRNGRCVSATLLI